MMTPERVVDVPDVPLELLRDTSARFSAGSRRSSLWDADTRRRSLTAPVFSSDLNVGAISRQISIVCVILCTIPNIQLSPLGLSLQVYSRPHCVKSRYGAWYLPTTLWKLQNADEVCNDPTILTYHRTIPP